MYPCATRFRDIRRHQDHVAEANALAAADRPTGRWCGRRRLLGNERRRRGRIDHRDDVLGSLANAIEGDIGGEDPELLVADGLKDLFGDLFLLGLLTIVLVAWRGFGVRP